MFVNSSRLSIDISGILGRKVAVRLVARQAVKVVPSERQWPMSGKGKTSFGFLRATGKQAVVSLRRVVRKDLKQQSQASPDTDTSAADSSAA